MDTLIQPKLAHSHPLAGATMSGADIIVQVLADEGVDTIFGYSGGAILPTYDAVFRYNQANSRNGVEPMPLIVPANEQGAGFMAAGYARASGRVGVVMVTSGPGATNCVTPVRDCMADSIPIVVICGQVPTAAIGSDAFQEAPVTAIMGSVAKHVFLVTDPLRLEATMRTAFEIARTGRPGPVVVDVPKDVQNWQGTFVGENQLPIPGYRQRLAAVEGNTLSDASCQQFFSMLGESRRPLIYAGGGVINANASSALRAFSGAFKIPVASTLMGLGGFDTKHPLSLHMLGMHGTASANYAVDDCDLLIVDRRALRRSRRRSAGQVRAEGETHPALRHRSVRDPQGQEGGLASRRPAAGGARCARRVRPAHGVRDELRRVARRDRGAEGHVRLELRPRRPLVQPQYVMETMNRITQGEAIISSGVGQHQMWAAQYCDFREPRLWLTSGSMGTMGFGLPAAIGAQIANPGKLVIDVDGDASIRMNLGELETVTTYNLPIKIVVLNNFGDGMVMQWQRLFFKGRLSASDKSLRKKDFVKTAQADGFGFAKRIDAKHDVPRVLEEFLSYRGPAFLEVIIDPTAGVYPMVGPGLSYREMITGDFIPNRYENLGKPPAPDKSEMF